jgi:hypothetical protein
MCREAYRRARTSLIKTPVTTGTFVTPLRATASLLEPAGELPAGDSRPRISDFITLSIDPAVDFFSNGIFDTVTIGMGSTDLLANDFEANLGVVETGMLQDLTAFFLTNRGFDPVGKTLPGALIIMAQSDVHCGPEALRPQEVQLGAASAEDFCRIPEPSTLMTFLPGIILLGAISLVTQALARKAPA